MLQRFVASCTPLTRSRVSDDWRYADVGRHLAPPQSAQSEKRIARSLPSRSLLPFYVANPDHTKASEPPSTSAALVRDTLHAAARGLIGGNLHRVRRPHLCNHRFALCRRRHARSGVAQLARRERCLVRRRPHQQFVDLHLALTASEAATKLQRSTSSRHQVCSYHRVQLSTIPLQIAFTSTSQISHTVCQTGHGQRTSAAERAGAWRLSPALVSSSSCTMNAWRSLAPV